MNTTKRGNVYITWVLRVLLILTILFWGLFSLDVFDEQEGFWDTLTAFFMHNIPSLAMLIILIIAWKNEFIGGILLMVCIAGFTVFLTYRSGNFMWGTLILVGIPFLTGAMFVINHYLPGSTKNEEVVEE